MIQNSALNYLTLILLFGLTTSQKRSVSQVEFPFLVSIRRKFWEIKDLPSIHVCSGILIDSQRILTAASCLHDFNGNFLHMSKSFEIIAGASSMSEDDSALTQVTYSKVSKIHPDFRFGRIVADLGIIVVENSFLLDNITVKAAQLETVNRSFGTKCSVFGRHANPKGIYKQSLTDKLYTTTVEINNECATYLFQDNLIRDSEKWYFICAGSSKEDTCFEDIGGPLVCLEDVVGIAVAYTSCEDGQKSTVYIELAKYADFTADLRNLPTNRAIENHLLPIVLGISAINFMPVKRIKWTGAFTARLSYVLCF